MDKDKKKLTAELVKSMINNEVQQHEHEGSNSQYLN